MNGCTTLVLVVALLSAASTAPADMFGSGVNAFDIPFTTIGAPNNPRDRFLSDADVAAPPGGGSVPYVYRLGNYEISERMIDSANALGGLAITKVTRGPNMPATGVSWLEAARFVNWLNTSTGHTPAYKITSRIVPGEVIPPGPRGEPGETLPDTIAYDFDLWLPSDPGYDLNNLFRNTQAMYFMPSHDEWYKGAYYEPVRGVYYDYPTGSDTAPTQVTSGVAQGTTVYGSLLSPSAVMSAGGSSPFGTVAQGGNASELLETEIDKLNNLVVGLRTVRGGSFDSAAANLDVRNALGISPNQENTSIGFRVASRIPEPSSWALLTSSMWFMRCRLKRVA